MSEENELPTGWIETRMGDIAWVTKLAGFEFTKYFKYQEAGPVRVVRGLNIGFGDFKAKDFKYIDSSISDALPRSQLKGGELLIAYVGTLGNAALLPYDGNRYHLGPNVGKVVVEPIMENASFLLYFLISLDGQQLIRSTSKAVTQSSLSMEQIRSFNVPIAPLAEQLRIVSAIEQQFTRLDEGVAALRKAQTKLKRYRAAVLKAAIEGKLTEAWRAEHPTTEPASMLLERILKERHTKWESDLRAKGKDPAKVKYVEPAKPDVEGLPSLPEGWCWATVAQVSSFVRYGTSAKTNEDASGIPILRMGNIQEGSLDLSNLKYLPENHAEFPNLLLENGDLLFNRTNSAELVGKSAIYRGNPLPCSYASYLINVRMVLGCLPDYLCFFLNSSYGRSWVTSVVSQQVGQANVNGSKLQALIFPLPPLEEQEQIVAVVEQRLSIVKQLESIVEANLKRAERLRQSILKEAFAGRLVPQDPDDEPASVLLESIRNEREQRKKGIVSNGRYPKLSSEPVKIDVEGTQQAGLWEGVGG